VAQVNHVVEPSAKEISGCGARRHEKLPGKQQSHNALWEFVDDQIDQKDQ
jgi:hypothetical protein